MMKRPMIALVGLTFFFALSLRIEAFVGDVINIVKWNANDLPKVYERSEQLPLTNADIEKLAASGFGTAAIIKMIEERRCACDVSADVMVALKQKGVDPPVISAMSLHALRPNRSINLQISFDFEGTSREARNRYLYIFVSDGPTERVHMANIGEILSGQWESDEMVDESDPVLNKQVRRVTFTGEVPLKTRGPKKVAIVSSTKPNLRRLKDIPKVGRNERRDYTFDYPRVSISNLCKLDVSFKQDAALAYQWHMLDDHFECEWD